MKAVVIFAATSTLRSSRAHDVEVKVMVSDRIVNVN